jgi:3-hydroxyacyl-CoA dehydrogenase/enoyl-CoA hydratase/3-hydroxybutyryl-CoA epimerase
MYYEHWQWHQDEQGWCWVEFDRKDKTANTLNLEVLLEFEAILGELEQAKNVKKIIICSKKRSGFIAGADIIEIFSQRDQEKTDYFIKKGQEVFQRLEKLTPPTIALIHGFCLGGGFELALACDWRIAIDTPHTKIGLPEVKLGLQPGWGGSVRTMRLLTPLTVFDFILTGKLFSAKKAKKIGLIDAAIPERVVHAAIESFNKKRVHSVSWTSWLMNLAPVRSLVSHFLVKKVSKKIAKEHYPAPFLMIDNWKHVGHLEQASYEEETRSITELTKSKTTQHLVNIFMMQDKAKKNIDSALPKIKHLHVIGAGVMGGDIAGWAALKGIHVTLQDVNLKTVQQALKRTLKLAQKQLDVDYKVNEVMDRLVIDPKGYGIQHADLIIEAVNENLELKRSLLAMVQEHAREDAFIATNTSTIPLEKMDDIFKNPARFIGVHFFNPVAQMPLVELVVGENTSAETVQRALKFVQQLEKFPLKVKSAPGFLVNRILLPYMLEALKLHQEGHSLETIDKAALLFGMPMGPIELADTVGLDVCLAAFSSLQLQDDILSAVLQKKIQEGHLGKKSHKGFYDYKNGKIQKHGHVDLLAFHQCESRLILCLCNEAVAAWRDNIVQTLEEMNAGSIFGFGFPPFRGGVMEYIKDEGIDVMKEKLITMEQRYGSRFKPDLGWEHLTGASS